MRTRSYLRQSAAKPSLESPRPFGSFLFEMQDAWWSPFSGGSTRVLLGGSAVRRAIICAIHRDQWRFELLLMSARGNIFYMCGRFECVSSVWFDVIRGTITAHAHSQHVPASPIYTWPKSKSSGITLTLFLFATKFIPYLQIAIRLFEIYPFVFSPMMFIAVNNSTKNSENTINKAAVVREVGDAQRITWRVPPTPTW